MMQKICYKKFLSALPLTSGREKDKLIIGKFWFF